MALDMEVALGPGHTVLDGDPAPLPKRGQTRRNFRPIFIVAERLSLGMEVGLNPGDFVLDGDPAPVPKMGGDLQFSAHVYLRATFHLNPSNRFATIHQRHRQDREIDRQRSNSIGRTVFGRPFVKRFALCYPTVVLSVLCVPLVHCGQTLG